MPSVLQLPPPVQRGTEGGQFTHLSGLKSNPRLFAVPFIGCHHQPRFAGQRVILPGAIFLSHV